MTRLLNTLASSLTILLIASCTETKPVESFSDNNVIPYPQSFVKGEGGFNVKGANIRVDKTFDKQTLQAAKDFAAQLSLTTGKKVCACACKPAKGAINVVRDVAMAPESYTLDVSLDRITIVASDRSGVLYAFATLRQLLPAAVYGSEKAADENWAIRVCTINDKPDFSYRGMHLDCSRHFFSVDEVKKYLRIMSEYKLNRFHWHLTDDQGWRAEIKAYPLLTEVGAYRRGTMVGKNFDSCDEVRYGGFYTQDEMKDVVAYADRLGITVVPEIDLPGHMLGALSAYPELGCTGGPYETWVRWGVSDDVLCVGKESTFEFLETVLGELADIFPGEYFHIGGDECPKAAWQKCPVCQAKIKELGLKDTEHGTKEQYLQNYVTARVQKIMAEKGKKIIGWDEITEGELEKGATVMYWRGWIKPENSVCKYTENGFDVIMTPIGHCYFDYSQAEDASTEPMSFGGFINLEKIYSMVPREGLSDKQAKHVTGLQANLWSEYIPTDSHLEYMLLPRMIGLSCVQWTGAGRPSYEEFLPEVQNHQYAILDVMGYNYKRY